MEMGMASKIIFIIALLFAPTLMAKTYIIQADGMMCQACVETITDGFKNIHESSDVKIDLELQTISVNIDDGVNLNPDTVKSLLNKRGYTFISMGY